MIEITEIGKTYEIVIESAGANHFFTFHEKEKMLQFLDLYLEHCKFGFDVSLTVEGNKNAGI